MQNLFDEVEKAHPDVFNVLLQILDDGRITDSQGKTVDFKNTIIILTSNLGADIILDGIDDNGNFKKDTEQNVMEVVKQFFRPEFLNRLDETIIFRPLSKDTINQIMDITIEDLNDRLKDKQITIKLTETAKTYIEDNSYNPLFGARPLKHYMQKTVESLVAKEILQNKIKDGDTVEIFANAEGLFIKQS